MLVNILIFLTIFLTAMVFGIALTASIVVHPILLQLKRASAIEVFSPFFDKTHILVLIFSLAATFMALLLSWASGNWWWLLVSLLMHLNGPYTVIYMMPLNRRLMDKNINPDSDVTATDLNLWGKLHAIRTLLNGLTLAILLAMLVWR